MKTLFRALVAVCAMSIWSGLSAGVIVGDKVWRQVTDTEVFSWDELSTVCDTTTGACAGSLLDGTTSTDFDGWTWASQADVTQLFQGIPGWDGPSVSFESHLVADSVWAPAFFDVLGFQPTRDATRRSPIRSISAFTRSRAPDNSNGAALAYDPILADGTITGSNDFASVGDSASLGTPYGGWFYQTVSSTPSVPAPPTLALLLVPALLLVAGRTQRQSH